MIEICNLRKEQPIYLYDVRVDRTSILGNPFFMAGEEVRDYVCDRYAEYFKYEVENNVEFQAEVKRLYNIHKQYGKLRLFCWCYPKRCHAEVIKNYLEKFLKSSEI